MPEISFTNGSVVYQVYASREEALNYAQGAIHAANWLAASEMVQNQSLVTATRLLDRQCWKGDKNTEISGNLLDWPRINTGIDGVTDDTVPEDIVIGSIELAFSLVEGSPVQNTVTPNNQDIETLKAGSVAITYFRPGTEALFAQTARFPTIVQELVGRYMCGSSLAVFGVATGVSSDVESVTADDKGYNEGI